VAASEAELALLLGRLAEYCRKRGITINYGKSKVMIMPHSPPPTTTTFQFQPQTPGAQVQQLEIVDTFRYLGTPISNTLKPGIVSDTARTKMWAAHHTAARAGMRPYGLSLASRVVAWKTFVWPHVLFYLPFVSLTDLPEIQAAVNTSLRCMTFMNASPEALAAEFGILPIRQSWAAAVATLGGRLQTNPAPLRAAALFSAWINSDNATGGAGSRTLGDEYLSALHQLQLRNHWPLLDTSCLPVPTDPLDILQLEHPQPGAAPAAPFRTAWCTLVRRAAMDHARQEFTSWLSQTDHRAASYKGESLAGLPVVPSRDTSAWWLTLPLSLRLQQLLLKVRVLASDLATHTPSAKRARKVSRQPKALRGRKRSRRADEDPYEESWCPLCARIPYGGRTYEETESLAHLLFDCPHLCQEQHAHHTSLDALISQMGGLCRDAGGHPSQWTTLPIEHKLGLILANPTTYMLFSFPDMKTRKEWMTTFQQTSLPHIRALMDRRTALILEYYPETTDTTS
jgi:hypothetical protein